MIEHVASIAPAGTVLTLLQSAQPGIDALVEQSLQFLTPERAALFGGSGLFSLGGARWLVNRRASSDVPPGTSVSTSDGRAVSTTARRNPTKHNVAFTLPSWLPLSEGIRHVTHTEIHATELGAAVGVASAWLYSLGNVEPLVGLVIAFVAGALGFKRYSRKTFETVRHEPWYGLVALAAGAALGWAIFVAEPGLLTQFELLAELAQLESSEDLSRIASVEGLMRPGSGQ